VSLRVSHKGPEPRPIKERLLSKIEVLDDCWVWRGPVYPNGYGYMAIGSKANGSRRQVLAHRLSYQEHVGPIPDGLSVLHCCDVRACVNPRHLFLGTHQDNMDDMWAKGRQPTNPRSLWTHCRRGHPFDLFNTYIKPCSGRRGCKVCMKANRNGVQ
jgi:hypothetical protein